MKSIYTPAMKISGAATVLQVSDIEASLRFYCEVLGFVKDFEFGPYAGVYLGECQLHLCAHTNWKRPNGGGAVSIFADEVDAYFAQVQAKGATVRLAPTDEDYGMRDFAVSDPDGNVLTFGCPLEGASASPKP